MIFKNKHFVIFITITLIIGCKDSTTKLLNIEGKKVPIDNKIASKKSIDSVISPYRERINHVLDSVLAYAPKSISKKEGHLNTSAGNLIADIVLQEASPIFKARTGKKIDFVLLNYGGIRAIISQGNITERTAFEVMPFENSVVIAELNGKTVRNLVSFLIDASVAHPIAGIQIIVDKSKNLQAINIQGEPFDENKTYYVATSDYLVNGGDKMNFLKENSALTNLNYLIRNTLIDYFKKMDTITAYEDDRFIQLP